MDFQRGHAQRSQNPVICDFPAKIRGLEKLYNVWRALAPHPRDAYAVLFLQEGVGAVLQPQFAQCFHPCFVHNASPFHVAGGSIAYRGLVFKLRGGKSP